MAAVWFVLLSWSTVPATAETRLCLNGIWQFQPQHEYQMPASFGAEIIVPGFWNHPEAFGYPEGWRTLPAGWFRRTVEIPADWRGQRIALRFDGIHMTGQIFFNGRHLANHWDCTNPITVDVTHCVKWGAVNQVTVGVRNAAAESDDLFEPFDPGDVGAGYVFGTTRQGRKRRALAPCGLMGVEAYQQNGLARDVWLIRSAPVYVDDVFVQTSVRERKIVLDYEIRNASDRPATAEVAASVTPWRHDEIVLDLDGVTVQVPPGDMRRVRLEQAWPDARLWDPDHPFLYTLHTSLLRRGAAPERSQERFGFREVWAEGRDLYLNGRRFNIRGDTLIPAVSFYLHEEKTFGAMCDLYRKLNINAVRVHGHGDSRTMRDQFDEAGIMMIAESALHGSAGDQAIEDPRFWELAHQHLRTMVRDQRNHPSIIVWSVENEMGAFVQRNDNVPWEKLSELTRVVKAHDPTRLAWHDGFGYEFNSYHRGPEVEMDVLSLHYAHGDTWGLYYHVPDSGYWAATVMAKPGGFGGLPVGCTEYGFIEVGTGWDRNGGGHAPLHSQAPLVGMRQATHADDSIHHYWPLHWQLLAWSIRGHRRSNVAAIGPFTIANHYLEQSGGRYPDTRASQRPFDWQTPGLKFPNVPSYWRTYLDVYSGMRPPYQWLDVIRPVAQACHPLLCFAKEYNTRFWSGAKVTRTLVAFNDLYRPSKRTLTVTLADEAGRPLDRHQVVVETAVGRHVELPVTLSVPRVQWVTRAKLTISHSSAGGREYEDVIPLTIFPPGDVPAVSLFDPEGRTASRLRAASVTVREVKDPADLAGTSSHLMLGEGALAWLPPADLDALRNFAEQGGTVVCLAQSDPAAFEAAWGRWATMETGIAHWPFEPERGPIPTTIAHLSGTPNPITRHVDSNDLRFWANDHAVAVHGLIVKEAEDVKSLVICNRPVRAERRDLLARIEHGKGRIYLCQLLLADNAGPEPVARTILARLAGGN